MKVAVLGGGHGCYAAAIDLAEKGHQVNLWRRDAKAFESIVELGGLTVHDHAGTRLVHTGTSAGEIGLHNSLEVAVSGADLIVIPLPALSHDELAEKLAPHLTDGQVVFLPPGTFGSYIFAKSMNDAANFSEVAFAETGTLPYLARKQNGTEVVVSGYATRLPTGVFPSRLSERAFTVLQEAYPSVEPIEDALSGALMNAGPVIHPPLILMNAGPLEHFPAWDIHNEGTQPSIRRVTNSLDNERIAVREALGYQAPHFPLSDHYSLEGNEWMYGRAAHEKLTDSGDWREKIDLNKHRYMLEDTRLGLSLIVSVGRWAGVPTPVAAGLLSIACAATGIDLYAQGRTLESLGLAELSRREMSDLLREGVKR